ncbi:Acyl-CoA-binding domain-containing protein 5 [Phlyctochytrium bullatum]|nr:Acyl-CoA-binding domain-containing protein 5 [Phlyctochytrium bullatum]
MVQASGDRNPTVTEEITLGHAGSDDSGRFLNDLHCLDTERLHWTELSVPDPLPAPRRSHAAAAYEGFLLIHGGDTGPNVIGDLHALHVTSHHGIAAGWMDLTPPVSSTSTPPAPAPATSSGFVRLPRFPAPRAHHAAFVHDGMLFLHGGSDGTHVFSEILLLPLAPLKQLVATSSSGALTGRVAALHNHLARSRSHSQPVSIATTTTPPSSSTAPVLQPRPIRHVTSSFAQPPSPPPDPTHPSTLQRATPPILRDRSASTLSAFSHNQPPPTTLLTPPIPLPATASQSAALVSRHLVWSVHPTPHQPRYLHAACLVGSHLFTFGGLDGSASHVASLTITHLPSLVTSVHPQLALLPPAAAAAAAAKPTTGWCPPRAGHALVHHRTRLFCFGGRAASLTPPAPAADTSSASSKNAENLGTEERGQLVPGMWALELAGKAVLPSIRVAMPWAPQLIV